MRGATRIAVFGPQPLRDAVATCGFEPADDGAVAVVDATDAEAMVRAAELTATTPRIIVAPPELHASLRAFGTDPLRIVAEPRAAAIGPVIAHLLPERARPTTRVVVVTGVRGGVGRTLLATNLARRLAGAHRVCLVDATGSGAAAWWLRVAAPSWSTLEGLAEEMSPEHLAVVAHEAAPGLHLVGAGYAAPSAAVIRATVRAAATSHDVVIVDAPGVHDSLTASLRKVADRWLVLAYDDPISADTIAASLESADWLIAAQSADRRLGMHDVFRALPRDEGAIAAAFAARAAVRGRLGRAYDELAEILAVDAS